jgi:hypothetical protein
MITKLLPRAFVAALAPEPGLPTRAEKPQRLPVPQVPQPLLEIIIDKCEKGFIGKKVPVRKVSFSFV